MSNPSLSQEQRILIAMRKTLGKIVRETTPDPGFRHPLSQGCIDDIRACFALIASRERELVEEAGMEIKERPRFGDEPKRSTVVPISRIGKKPTGDKSD